MILIRIFLPAQPALTDAKEVQTKTPEKDSAIESAKIDSNTNVKKVNSGLAGCKATKYIDFRKWRS
jgi:hypothetical protein